MVFFFWKKWPPLCAWPRSFTIFPSLRLSFALRVPSGAVLARFRSLFFAFRYFDFGYLIPIKSSSFFRRVFNCSFFGPNNHANLTCVGEMLQNLARSKTTIFLQLLAARGSRLLFILEPKWLQYAAM